MEFLGTRAGISAFLFFWYNECMKNLERLFNPRSVAVVGASPHKRKLGSILARNILDGGWKKNLYLVNPRHGKIGSRKCYAGLGKIRKPVDLVLIAVPAPSVGRILLEGAGSAPKIENYIVISSGFKETGAGGKKLEDDLRRVAEANKLNVLGPNCLGFINPALNLNATFAAGKYKKGKVAIVSQSGALAVALLDWIAGMSVGFSKVISIGNKAVLDECDAVRYLAGDKNTKAIALYLEDIKDGRKFSETVAAVGGRKPVIILKAGKNKTGQKAVSSHTGSLAQDEAVAEAIFEKLNVIEVKTVEEFQDLMLFAGAGGISAGREEVIVLTNAGGPGVLASDFIGRSKCLKTAKISPETKSRLKKVLPASASVENPIDVVGDAAPDRYRNVLEIISRKHPQNPLLLILTPQSQTDPDKVARLAGKYGKIFSTFAACFMGGAKIKKSVDYLRASGVANFENPERALAAIEKMACFKKNKVSSRPALPQKTIRLKLKANSIIQSALKEKRKLLYWAEAAEVFRSYGVLPLKAVSFAEAGEIGRAAIKYPCVLKTDDPKIVHRWDRKAVALNLSSKKELLKAYEKMKKSTGAKKYLIQPMAKPGLELIIGLKRDKSFGPVIVLGLGGTFTEIFKDSVILVPPLTAGEVKSGLKNLKISRILRGFRGERGYDAEEIAKIVLALQQIAAENPDIGQIDVNPVMLYNDGSRLQLPDVKIYLQK